MSEPGSAYRLSVLEERWRSDRSPRVFLQLADELRRAGRVQRAVEVLRDGLRWHPESVSGWVALGRNLLDEGDARAAIEALEGALERDTGQLVATKLLTEAWIRVGDADRAAASLERARLLSLPDADREQLAQQIGALRASGGSPAPAAAAAVRRDAPFELAMPAALPEIDLERAGPGRRGWRRVAIAAEPFADLLAVPRAAATLDHALRAPGIFGGVAAEPAAAPPAEMAALAPPMAFVAEIEAPVEPAGPTAEAEAPAEPAAPAALFEAIFQPHSIGEEVERETMEEALAPPAEESAPAIEESAPALEEAPPAVAAATPPAATITLAALYFAQGHLDEAEAEYRAVLAARPDDAEARAGLAELARRRAAALAAGAAVAAPRPAGLTARRLQRLRGVYDRLRVARRGRHARVS